MAKTEIKYSGFIAIIGRPNVGKSTLLNRILGKKLSITANKPQTTRHRILGIKNVDETQFIYIDTPGIHLGQKRALNKYMNKTAISAMHDVDVIIFIVELDRWNDEDEFILNKLKKSGKQVILVINKVDRVNNKELLLPMIEKLSNKFSFSDVVPMSALKGSNVSRLEKTIATYLTEGPQFYPDDQITDRSQKFMAAEFIREKITRLLAKEVPYAVSIEIESFEEKNKILHIHAIIWVERKGQKAIIIGESGSQLKKIGQQARIDMEKSFSKKVFLQLWVKVKESWSDDERALRSLGYE